jgi:hypothetical protein
VGGEDGQLALAGVAGQPGQRLPRCGRLAVVLPVLVEDPGHLGQLGPGRIGQRSNPEAIHAAHATGASPVQPGIPLPERT